MEMKRENILVMIPAEEWDSLKAVQIKILDCLDQINTERPPVKPNFLGYLTAIEFMNAVHIRRSKFDQLVAGNKIKTIKKKRKIYVPASEVERYFSDSSIL
jgi:hypothetical protein